MNDKSIIKLKKRFTYFHTHYITEEILNTSVQLKKSIELDINIDKKGEVFKPGKLYIGHSLDYYKFKGEKFIPNMPLGKVIERLRENKDVLVVFDLKNKEVIDGVMKYIKILGPERCMVHSFIKEWTFGPFPKGLAIEPQWVEEDIALKDIQIIKDKFNIPIIGSARITKPSELTNKELSTILETGKDIVDIYGFYATKLNLPTLLRIFISIIKVYRAGKLPIIKADMFPFKLPFINYVAITDKIEKATTYGHSGKE